MSYNKNIWKRKDRITKEKLNHMEDGIYTAHDKINVINNKIENEQMKNGFINFDYFYSGSDNDDDRLNRAFEFCKNNKMTLVINRKVILTRPILDYDFTFSIIGNGTTSELFLDSDSVVDVFLILLHKQELLIILK